MFLGEQSRVACQQAPTFAETMKVLETAQIKSMVPCVRHGLCPLPRDVDLCVFGAPCVADSTMGKMDKDESVSRKVSRLTMSRWLQNLYAAFSFVFLLINNFLGPIHHLIYIYIHKSHKGAQLLCHQNLVYLYMYLVLGSVDGKYSTNKSSIGHLQATMVHLKVLKDKIRPKLAISEKVPSGNINWRIVDTLKDSYYSKAHTFV